MNFIFKKISQIFVKNKTPLKNFTISFNEAKKRSRIVVIDDDENSFPVEILRKEGYSIDYWKSIDPGNLKELEAGNFDIIILDIGGVAQSISSQDGLGVLEHLKTFNPLQIVVAFSGQTFDIGKSAFWKLADDTLPKPVDAIKCKRVLDNLISEKFSVENHFNLIRQILEKQGISKPEIEEIAEYLTKKLNKREKIDDKSTLEKLSDYGEAGLAVLKIANQLYDLLN